MDCFPPPRNIARTFAVSWLLASTVMMAQDIAGTPFSAARQLLLSYTERIRWQHYWLPDTVGRSYYRGREIQFEVLLAGSAAGFCAPALEVCQIYERSDTGVYRFLTEWTSDRQRSETGLPERFAREYAAARPQLQSRPAVGDQPMQQPMLFDTTKVAEPARLHRAPETFGNPLYLKWKLLPLTPPKSVSSRMRPPDVALLSTEIAATAKSFRTARCATGKATIPFYSVEDTRVFVEVDLGGRCEKGVFAFERRPEGGWGFGRFTVAKIDVEHFVARIRRAAMVTIYLPD